MKMIPKPHIREADSGDVSLLSGLVRECFHDVAGRFGLTLGNCPKHPSHCTDKWIENDFARAVIYYILESDVMAVGCVAIERASSDLCYLERLGVLPEARRNGFDRSLVDHVFIFNNNTEGVRFWNKIGWSQRFDISLISKTIQQDSQADLR
jgi:hypothetical protein